MIRLTLTLLCAACLACSDPPTDAPPAPASPATSVGVQTVSEALAAFRGGAASAQQDASLGPIRQLLAQRRLPEARAQLEARVASSGGGEAQFLLGWLHASAERWDLAREPLAAALAAGPSVPKGAQAFYLYARALEETGDLAGARAAYAADAELHPTQGDGPFRIARLELEAGDLASARAEIARALERFQRPQDVAKSHALSADVHLAEDDLEGARAALERCVAAFPHYEAYFKLSRVCRDLGDDTAADEYLQRHRIERARAGR